MKKLYLIPLATVVLLTSCKKIITNSNINGAFILRNVAEKKAFARNPTVSTAYSGATFIYADNNQLTITKDADTLRGTYRLYRSANGSTPAGDGSDNEQAAMEMNAVNRTNTKFFQLTLLRVRYQKDRTRIIGNLEQPGRDYEYEFERQ